MAEHHFHEFVGAVVAQIVLEMLIAPHIEGLTVVDGSDDIPCGAAASHQIEGGEPARHVERLEIGGRAGRCEPEFLGDHCHRGQHHDRIHLHAADAVFDGMPVIVAVAIRHRQTIVEESHVKFAGFENPGDLLVIIRRHRIVARFRMPPRTRQIGAILRLQESDQRHLPRHAVLRLSAGSDIMSGRVRRPVCTRPPARAICPRWRPRPRFRQPCVAVP